MLKWLMERFGWLSDWKPPLDRVNMEAERLLLDEKRLKVDSELEELLPKEAAIIQDGAAATSVAVKHKLASDLIRLRRTLRRLQTLSGVYAKQSGVLEVSLSNLMLKEEGRAIDLPTPEQMTADASEAEQIMADLDVRADLARSIEVGSTSPLDEEEQAAILEEFRAAAGERAATATPERTPDIHDPEPYMDKKPEKGRTLERV